MRHILGTLAAASGMLALVPSPVRADDAAASHYVQCLMAASGLLDSRDPDRKSAGLMAVNFFTGAIFGAAPNIDLTAAVRRESRLLDAARSQALLVQCGGEMQRRGDQVSAAGQALTADAAGAKPAP